MKKAEVEKRILTAYNILYRTMLAYHRAKYLNIGDTVEERQTARVNSFISHARFALWYLAVVEACKLFQNNSNQKYNLHRLINILHNNRGKAYLRDKITKAEIEHWKSLLNSPENSRIIEQLSNLRGQFYAHTDDVGELFLEKNTPFYQDMERIFQMAQDILSEVAKKVLDSQLDFRPTDLTSTRMVMRLLVAERERMKREAVEEILEMKRRIEGT